MNTKKSKPDHLEILEAELETLVTKRDKKLDTLTSYQEVRNTYDKYENAIIDVKLRIREYKKRVAK